MILEPSSIQSSTLAFHACPSGPHGARRTRILATLRPVFRLFYIRACVKLLSAREELRSPLGAGAAYALGGMRAIASRRPSLWAQWRE